MPPPDRKGFVVETILRAHGQINSVITFKQVVTLHPHRAEEHGTFSIRQQQFCNQLKPIEVSDIWAIVGLPTLATLTYVENFQSLLQLRPGVWKAV